MSDDNSAPISPSSGHQWDQSKVYLALSDATRRGMLLSLARRGPQPASDLKTSGKKRLDATLKHLISLRQSGLVVTKENPVDGRKQLYALSPAVEVRQTETGAALHFGFCMIWV